MALSSPGRARHRMRRLVEPVGRRSLLRARMECPLGESRRAWGLRSNSPDFRELLAHTVYEHYSLADRPRLDAALLEAKGYAHRAISRKAQRTIDQLNQQLVAAYAEIKLEPQAPPAPGSRHVAAPAGVVRRASTPGRRRHGHRQDGDRRPRLRPALRARPARPRLLFVAHREQILDQARALSVGRCKDPGFGELLTGSADPPRLTATSSRWSRRCIAGSGRGAQPTTTTSSTSTRPTTAPRRPGAEVMNTSARARSSA